MNSHRLFNAPFLKTAHNRPPVWMMRQAGRYQASYQALRKEHTFEQLCIQPQLAAEVAMNAIDEFDFDAAILFSDILYIVSAMGPKLKFDPGPQFEYLLRSTDDLAKYTTQVDIEDYMGFQKEALELTRKQLPDDKGLIAFTGGILTIYNFAVEGSARKSMDCAIGGIQNGLFEAFCDKMVPLLVRNIDLQLSAQPDAFAMFDSGLGFMCDQEFDQVYWPILSSVLTHIKTNYPQINLLYYAKTASKHILNKIATVADTLASTSDWSLQELFEINPRITVQGNFNEQHLALEPDAFKREADAFFEHVSTLDKSYTSRWIAALGHGVTPQAKVENVRYFVDRVKQLTI